MTERSDRRIAWAVFGVLFASYAYFYQGGGWNENSRMDLVRALVDDHTIHIDRYHHNTGDKAKHGGHYYSDKAPGLSLLGVPVYFIFRALAPAFRTEHDYVVFASYAVTVFTVSAASALLGALLYLAARRLGASSRGAVIAAAAYGLGTMAFPLSTLFFSHQLTALLLFVAFALLWSCRDDYSDARSLLAGLACAAAAVVEFPAAPVLVILGAYHALPDRRLRRLATFGAGLVVPALLLLGYLWVAFGSPLRVGYDLLADPASRDEMRTHGLFGVTYPKVSVLVELLIGRYRGLLPYSPVLLLSGAGFVLLSRHRRERAAALAIVVYYLLFVSSYTWWQGGSSFSSRHLAPMLPFLALPLGLVADRRPKLTLAALVYSVAVMTVVTSVQPKISERVRSPLWGALLPAFVNERLAANDVCTYDGRASAKDHRPVVSRASNDAFNVGMLLGGRSYTSLVPLAGLWLASALAFWLTTRPELGQGDPGARDPPQ